MEAKRSDFMVFPSGTGANVVVPKSLSHNPDYRFLLIECISLRMVGNPAWQGAAQPARAARLDGSDMAEQLRGKRVAILAADGVERVEVEQPRDALQQAGADIDLLSLQEGEIQARDHDLEPAGAFPVDGLVAHASVDDYDALLLPGGTVNPDKLRMDEAAVGFVRDFVESGKPVAAICHGPWTLVEAGVVAGRSVTSYQSIRTDLRNAGANVVDQEVATDGNLITSRSPKDLPAFCDAILETFARSGEPIG
jgi:protease I